MKLFKVEIPKKALDAIPKNEVVFFIQCGSLLNEIAMLQKLVFFSMNRESANAIENMAQNLQAQCLLRIQAGKLKEGWELLQNHFFGAKVSKLYESKLDQKAQKSLESLKTYFGKSNNIISLIRKEYAFHYPSSDTITKTLDAMPGWRVFPIFMSENFGNCAFTMSNDLATWSICESTEFAEGEKAMKKWIGDIVKVSGWFCDFLGECLKVFAESHVGFKSSEVEILEPLNLNEIVLPYFVKSNE